MPSSFDRTELDWEWTLMSRAKGHGVLAGIHAATSGPRYARRRAAAVGQVAPSTQMTACMETSTDGRKGRGTRILVLSGIIITRVWCPVYVCCAFLMVCVQRPFPKISPPFRVEGGSRISALMKEAKNGSGNRQVDDRCSSLLVIAVAAESLRGGGLAALCGDRHERGTWRRVAALMRARLSTHALAVSRGVS